MATEKPKKYAQNFLHYFEKHYLFLTFLLSLGASLCSFGVFFYLAHDVFYIDTDGYTRALRITDWLNDFQWSEKIFPYYNPTQGFVLHWTRICDIIWFFLALPFLLFLPNKEAVFYGGLMFSPLFMALSMVVIIWGIKPYLADFEKKASTLLTVIVALLFYAVKLNDVFDAVRPDHHSLMCFIFCVNVAIIIRVFLQQNFKLLFLAGIAGGCGIWASSAVEGFWLITMILFVVLFNWIFYAHSIKEALYYAFGVFASVIVAWAINPPLGGWHIFDTQRLSVIHVILTGLMLASFYCLTLLNLQHKIKKVFGLACVSILTVVIMFLFFGIDIWFQPLFAPDTWEYCLKYTGEIQHLPLLSYETPSIILTFLTFIWLLFLCGRQKHLTNLGILTLICFVTTIIFWRFYAYLVMLFLFLCGLMLFKLLYRAQSSIRYKWLTFVYLVAPMLLLIAFYMSPKQLKIPSLKGNALIDVLDVPEVVFNQNIDAVGGPYHTNVEGITDNHLMWFTTDENELKKLIKKHNIRSVYLKPHSRPDYYVEPEKNTDKLYGMVMTGENLYDWLEPRGEFYVLKLY